MAAWAVPVVYSGTDGGGGPLFSLSFLIVMEDIIGIRWLHVKKGDLPCFFKDSFYLLCCVFFFYSRLFLFISGWLAGWLTVWGIIGY
jgi:hypothetical protein